MPDEPEIEREGPVDDEDAAVVDAREEAPIVGSEVRKLQDRLVALEGREKELLDRLARLQADFENFRRRAREDAAQAKTAGKLDFVKAIIPVIDNLERALSHSKDEGLALLAKHMQATLAGAGLVVLSPEGEGFDAKIHEAIAQEAREGAKAGTVLTVVEKGYLLDGKLVRPARVIVAS